MKNKKIFFKKLNNKLKRNIYIWFPPYRFIKSIFKINLKDFKNVSNIENIPSLYLTFDYFISSYIYGCISKDYLINEFYKKSKYERKKYVVESDVKLIKKFYKNATDEDKLCFDKKGIFNVKFKKFIKRKFFECNYKSTNEDILNFISQFKKIVIKPQNLMGGNGIEVIEVNNVINDKKFYDKLKINNYLIEEVLTQHKDLERLNPTSINTIRVVAAKDIDDNIIIVGCCLRVGKIGMTCDNISKGAIGYPIDPIHGVVCSYGKDIYGNKIYINEQSNEYMIGYKIPLWNEVLTTVKEAMFIVKKMNLIGWDICVKNNSVEIVEGNSYPGVRTYQMGGYPKKDLLKQLVKLYDKKKF